MNKRRKNNGSEINLTPLLDVLFSILFIVMMTGQQNEDGMRAQHRSQVDNMQAQIQEYEEQIADYKSRLATYELVQKDIIVLTVSNYIKGGVHYLSVTQGTSLLGDGQEDQLLDDIKMGSDKLENLKLRLSELTEKLIEEHEGQPVYIVFAKDSMAVYTYEYQTIVGVFNALEEKNKEVFFKELEKE